MYKMKWHSVIFSLFLLILTGINCSTLTRFHKINDFFTPDEITYTSIQLPFDRGLRYIQNIKGINEEIFISYPVSKNKNMNFIDIGFNAESDSNHTSVYYDTNRLIEFISNNRIHGYVYFIHNHPPIGLNPPSLQDFYTLSNLKKEFKQYNLDINLVGLVATENGIWKYDTNKNLELKIFNILRTSDNRYRLQKSYLSSLFFYYSQSWVELAQNFKNNPARFCLEMKRKGILIEYYESSKAYVRSLKKNTY